MKCPRCDMANPNVFRIRELMEYDLLKTKNASIVFEEYELECTGVSYQCGNCRYATEYLSAFQEGCE